MSTLDPHLSPYELDSLRLGRLHGDRARTARDHLAACAACRGLEASLAADQRRFVDEVLPRTRTGLHARAQALEGRASLRRWLLLTVLPIAPAAALLLLLAGRLAPTLPVSQSPAAPVYQGQKGGADFQVVGERKGRVFPVPAAG